MVSSESEYVFIIQYSISPAYRFTVFHNTSSNTVCMGHNIISSVFNVTRLSGLGFL